MKGMGEAACILVGKEEPRCGSRTKPVFLPGGARVEWRRGTLRGERGLCLLDPRCAGGWGPGEGQEGDLGVVGNNC